MSVPYRAGFETQTQEHAGVELPVEGTLPDWLAGTLVRNGPGQFEVGSASYRHWFDGLALLKSFSITAGRVTYRSRYLRTPAYEDDRRRGRITYRGFAVDPCMNLFKKVMAVFVPNPPGSNTVVSVAHLAGRYLAMTEAPIAIAFDPATLATLGAFDFGGEPISAQTATAHPHADPATGVAYNLFLHFDRTSHYQVNVFEGHQRRVLASIPVKRPAYMHSFALTPRYVVLAEFSLRLPDLRALIALGVGHRPFIENFRWCGDEPTIFILIDRQTGQVVARVEAEPFFAFHHINAYEEGDAIVCDVSAYDDADLIGQLYLDNLRAGRYPRLAGQYRRYRVPLDGNPATYDVVTSAGIELPRMDEALNTRRHRYVYGVSLSASAPDFVDRLVKVDAQSGTASIWHEPGSYPSEPVFVPRPGAEDEDDGVLLSVVLDSQAGASSLVVLSARDLRVLARAQAPQVIPFDFHGQFWPGVGPNGSSTGQGG